MSTPNKMVFIGIVIGVLYWILESAVHAYLLKEGTFTQQMLNPHPHDAWMRSIFAFIFILFSIFVQRIIFKHKQAEESLRESERKYRALSKNIPGMVYRARPDWSTEIVSKSESICGYSVDEFNSQKVSWLNIIHPDDKEQVLKESFPLTQKPLDIMQVYRIISKDGGSRWVEDHKTSFFSKEGVFMGINGVVFDITERKFAEEALRTSEASLAEAQRIANLGNWDWNVVTNELHWSDEIYRIFGLKPQEFGASYEAFLDSVHPDNREYVKKSVDQALYENKPYNIDHRIALPGGEVRFVHEQAEVTFDDSGKPIRMVGTVQDITRRRKAEEELQASENKYRTLLENLPQKIFLKDKNSVYLSCNENYAKDLKIKPEEIAGKTDYEFYPKELAEKYRGDDKRLMDSGETEDIEERYIQDGQDLFVHTIKTPVKDEQGNIIGILGMFWDITEQKRAEEALHKRTHDLGKRVKELNCLYGISRLAGRPDISLKEILQGTVDLIPPSWQYPEVTCARVFLEGQEFRTDNFKETIWKQASNIIVYGDRIGTVEVCYLEEKPESEEGPFLKEERDLINAVAERLGRITERKRAEEALQESEEKYRTLVENASDFIFMIDEKGKVLSLNKSAAILFRKKPDEIIGKSIFDLFPNEVAIYFSKNLKNVFQTGESQSSEGRMIVGKMEMWISTNLNPLRNREGKTAAVMGVTRDITERKKTEEEIKNKNLQLQRLNKELEDFTYIVSHDLKSPLINVQGFSTKLSEICEETKKELKELSRLYGNVNLKETKDKITGILEKVENNVPLSLEFIRTSIAKMDSLIKSILNLSRISTRRKPLEPVDLNLMLKEIISSLEYQIQEKSIELEVLKLPEVYCEKERINQVFSNLLTNAINYLGENPHPKIEVGYEDKGVSFQFYVEDNGIGIEEKYFDRIFQLFKRIGEVEAKGDGMGLAYVKKIIQQHQGEIWVESVKRKGSRFYFTLPKKEAKVDARKEIREYSHSGG